VPHGGIIKTVRVILAERYLNINISALEVLYKRKALGSVYMQGMMSGLRNTVKERLYAVLQKGQHYQ
jgi:hypothetical protein